MSLRLNGQLVWGDYLRAQYLHLRPRTSLAVVGIVFLVLSSWALYIFFRDWLSAGGSWLLPAIFGAAVLYLVLHFSVILPFNVYRIFKQQKSLSLPFSVEASSESFSSFNETGKTVMPWSHFVKWKESRTLFLLYHSNVLFNLLPKRLFQSEAQLNEFREFLRDVRRVGYPRAGADRR